MHIQMLFTSTTQYFNARSSSFTFVKIILENMTSWEPIVLFCAVKSFVKSFFNLILALSKNCTQTIAKHNKSVNPACTFIGLTPKQCSSYPVFQLLSLSLVGLFFIICHIEGVLVRRVFKERIILKFININVLNNSSSRMARDQW